MKPQFSPNLKNISMCAQDGNKDLEFIEEPKGPFIHFIPEVSMMAGIENNNKTYIPTLAEFTSPQFNDADCSSVFASDGTPNTRFNVERDEVLVRVSILDDVTQWVVSGSLSPRSFGFVTIPFWLVILTNVNWTVPCKKSCIGRIWPMTSTLQCATVASLYSTLHMGSANGH